MLRQARYVALAVVLAVMLAGCKTGFRAPTREAVVDFKPGVTHADQVRVHGLCDDVPHAKVEPLPSSTVKLSTRMFPVRFRVDDASDAELHELYQCLRADPSVAGVHLTGVDN